MSTPRPYWADDRVSLYLGDMREVLPALGVTADLVLADPPYGETSLPWDRWPEGWPEAAATVSQSLWCFGSLRMYLEHVAEFRSAKWQLSRDIIWEKHNGTGFADDRFKRVHEQPTHWYRGTWAAIHHEVPRMAYSGPDKHSRARYSQTPHTGEIGPHHYEDDGTRLARSVQKHKSVRRGIHSTEKPVGLLDLLIRYATPVSALVVDPFAGSGSTLEAARLCGRRAIGIEGYEPHARLAARRLAQADLFGGEVAL